mmetsp:Transcript_8298/g.27927  ORF Transcript_8298/g.27927 Transcript_8298/m.27927 type:complete len:247 (-) Transcript_8298:222-962(-)
MCDLLASERRSFLGGRALLGHREPAAAFLLQGRRWRLCRCVAPTLLLWKRARIELAGVLRHESNSLLHCRSFDDGGDDRPNDRELLDEVEERRDEVSKEVQDPEQFNHHAQSRPSSQNKVDAEEEDARPSRPLPAKHEVGCSLLARNENHTQDGREIPCADQGSVEEEHESEGRKEDPHRHQHETVNPCFGHELLAYQRLGHLWIRGEEGSRCRDPFPPSQSFHVIIGSKNTSTQLCRSRMNRPTL